jgi:hypothetical protein
MVALPPGAGLHMEQNAALVTTPIWLYWLQLAHAHAVAASDAIPSDELIDNLSARLAGQAVEPLAVNPDSDDMTEMKEAMGAISSPAHAIDGFYGAVKPLINPPRSNAKRHRQILEALKLGFVIGSYHNAWLDDLDWLFETRDGIVHHGEEFRPLVVRRVTAETLVGSGLVAYRLSAANAQRAAMIAEAVIVTCVANPKPSTANWVQNRKHVVSSLDRFPSSTP